MIHLDPAHKLSREFEALYDALYGEKTNGVAADDAHEEVRATV